MSVDRILLDFLDRWRQCEFEALRDSYTERDETIYRRRLAALEGFYARGHWPHAERPAPPDEEWFRLGDDYAKRWLMPRVIFQVKEYRHPAMGSLWRAYVSHVSRTLDASSAYFACMFVARQDEDLRLISTYHVDLDATQLRPDLRDWCHRGGQELDQLGRLSAVMKLQAPTEPRDLAEYRDE